MRFRDKNGPLHHPILKPANLPDFLTVARREQERGFSSFICSISIRRFMARTLRSLFWITFDLNRSSPESRNSNLKFSATQPRPAKSTRLNKGKRRLQPLRASRAMGAKAEAFGYDAKIYLT